MTKEKTIPKTCLQTRLLHIGAPSFIDGYAPVNVPIVRTSTIRFESESSRESLHSARANGGTGSTYGRHGTQTHRALEDAIGEIEQANSVLLTPSGLSAIALVFIGLLSPGDHVLVQNSVYGPVRELLEPLLLRLGVHFTYFSVSNDSTEALLRSNTKMIYVESPSSLLYEIADLSVISEVCREHKIVLAADNTWGAGLVYQPLVHGADISVQAATKYLSGHADLMEGSVSTRDSKLARQLRGAHDALGLIVSADDAYLTLRGIRTLKVRLAQHASSALTVSRYLQSIHGFCRANAMK